MTKIYFNVQGSLHGGGPSVYVARMTKALRKRGHEVTFKDSRSSDVAMCIINTGKILNKVDRNKTRVILRIDGIYNKLYNEKFNRKIRPDMVALHDELKRDLPLVDHTVYQSEWSRDSIWDEIVRVDRDYSIIHNAVDEQVFRPLPKDNSVLKLIHVGRIRDDYLMRTLIKTYQEVIRRGRKTQLLLVGGMDGPSKKVYQQHKDDKNIVHLGAFPNDKLAKTYAQGHIFLDARQGASSNNVVAESQACGVPVITPSWGGSQEMVIHKQSGMVVDGGMWDYDDNYVKNIADGVEYVMDNYTDMSRMAREHAVKELTIEKMVDKYLKAMGI